MPARCPGAMDLSRCIPSPDDSGALAHHRRGNADSHPHLDANHLQRESLSEKSVRYNLISELSSW